VVPPRLPSEEDNSQQRRARSMQLRRGDGSQNVTLRIRETECERRCTKRNHVVIIISETQCLATVPQPPTQPPRRHETERRARHRRHASKPAGVNQRTALCGRGGKLEASLEPRYTAQCKHGTRPCAKLIQCLNTYNFQHGLFVMVSAEISLEIYKHRSCRPF